MMTRKSNFLVKRGILAVVLFFSLSTVFAQAENKKWIIASEKFKYSKGQSSNAVAEATAETLPSRILEKMAQAIVRSVLPDERLDRTRYESRKERTSLFLQLSNEYKKRDAIVLNNYSEHELKKKIKEQEASIKAIKDKIDENIKKLKEAEEETEKLNSHEEKERERQEKISTSELWKYSTLMKHLFVKDEDFFTVEDISFYRDDFSALFTPSEATAKTEYTSYAYEKECTSSNINTLLTGTITAYGDYLSIAVEMYLYPGAKLIGSVVEVGSIQELDFICTNIARQLIPVIANSMPVQVQIAIGPEDIPSEVFLYIDDQLQTTISPTMIFDSGVHSIQFTAEGYQTVSTSYYFEGNKNYQIEVNLEEKKIGQMQIGLNPTGFDMFLQKLPWEQKYSQYGKIYTNGIQTSLTQEGLSQITINGNKILGQFISEDGQTDFFYIPEKLIADGSKVTINPKSFDRSEYIDKSRRWMYGTYSALITSLIPSFYCYGRCSNLVSRYNSLLTEGVITMDDYYEAVKWQKATKICMGISIGCGVLFGIELVNYFKAANSVLPEKAKVADMVNPLPVRKETEVAGEVAGVETEDAGEGVAGEAETGEETEPLEGELKMEEEK